MTTPPSIPAAEPPAAAHRTIEAGPSGHEHAHSGSDGHAHHHHAHPDRPHDHRHPTHEAVAARPRPSLIRASLGLRLGLAALLSGLIWAGVWWAGLPIAG